MTRRGLPEISFVSVGKAPAGMPTFRQVRRTAGAEAVSTSPSSARGWRNTLSLRPGIRPALSCGGREGYRTCSSRSRSSSSQGSHEWPEAFKVVAALDLSVMVPTLTVGGILLWRRQPWGYVIAAIGSIQGALYLLVLSVNSIVAIRRGLVAAPGELPIWGMLMVFTTAVAVAQLASVCPECAAVRRSFPHQARRWIGKESVTSREKSH